MMDMGLTKGVQVHVRKVAPFADPVELIVRGYELSLRKAIRKWLKLSETKWFLKKGILFFGHQLAVANTKEREIT